MTVKNDKLKKKRVWTMAEVAEAIGWETDRVTDLLVAAGAAFKPDGYRWWLTSESRMRRKFPDFFEELEAQRDADVSQWEAADAPDWDYSERD